MNKLRVLCIVLLVLLLLYGNHVVEAKDVYENSVLFYSPTCSTCLEIKSEMRENEYFKKLNKLDVSEKDNLSIFTQFCDTYQINSEQRALPILFVGEKFYCMKADIIQQIESGAVKNEAKPLLDDVNVVRVSSSIKRVSFAYVLTAGLLDGVNPCAIAMLIMLISLIGFTKDRKQIVLIGLSYISGIFISYYLLGTILYSLISYFDFTLLNKVIRIIILLMCFVLCILNVKDAIMYKTRKLAKITLQLPNGIRNLNKKLMNIIINKKVGKLTFMLFFALGFLISLTEFMCTGQIYLPVILSLKNSIQNIYVLFLVYNLAFVVPLIFITSIAVITKSVVVIGGKVVEKTYLIKILNAVFFLALAIYILF